MRDILIGLLVGLFSGLFGVGGGIILVPLLVLVVHIEQKQAQATSLVVVAMGATSGGVAYALGGSVYWLSVPFLIAGGIVGTWLGTVVVNKVQARWLQLLFALLLIVAALRLGLEPFFGSAPFVDEMSMVIATGFAATGLVMGFLSALLGVGGGIIVIPLLVAVFGFPQQLAAGTSLIAMIPLALFGALRLTRSGFTQWAQGFRMGSGSVIGAIGGASLALITAADVVQIAFATLLVFAAVNMVVKALR